MWLSTPVIRVTGGDSSWSANAWLPQRIAAATKSDLIWNVRVGARIKAPGQQEICHGQDRVLTIQALGFSWNSTVFRCSTTGPKGKTKGTNLTAAQHECETAREHTLAAAHVAAAELPVGDREFVATTHDLTAVRTNPIALANRGEKRPEVREIVRSRATMRGRVAARIRATSKSP
jgi:hypothetical protein